MRLALKLALAFTLANMLLAGIYGYLAIGRDAYLFQRELDEEAQELGPGMECLLTDAWKTNGDRGVREALKRFCGGQEQPVRIRWVWFESKDEDSPLAAKVTPVVLREHGELEATGQDGTGYLVIYWPVKLATEREGGLEFAHPIAALTASQHDSMIRTGLLIAGMALISVLLAVLLGIRFVGRPLERLIAKARRIGGGDLGEPIHIRTHDELDELAEDLNTMCAKLGESQRKLQEETAARIAAMEQLRHADRLKTVGRLASGIAHELGTPLNVVAGRAGLIASGKLDAAGVSQSADAIRDEADKMTRIIRQLLDFARTSTPRKQPVDLCGVVRHTIDLLGAIAEKQNVRLQFEPCEESAAADLDAGQIQQVLTNLTMNAIQAMPQGGQVDFRVGRRKVSGALRLPMDGGTRTVADAAEFFTIEVRDHGIGIPPENIPQLFEPFFTTKEVGAGTGLGLSIAYGIVQEHGGWIDVASRVGEGSCFTVFVPVEAKP